MQSIMKTFLEMNDNSVCYRFIVKKIEDMEVLKSKVRHNFITTEVDILNLLFKISGHENLKDQLKFYLKLINNC